MIGPAESSISSFNCRDRVLAIDRVCVTCSDELWMDLSSYTLDTLQQGSELVLMASAIKLREVAFPKLFAQAA